MRRGVEEGDRWEGELHGVGEKAAIVGMKSHEADVMLAGRDPEAGISSSPC